eukprot:gene5358-6670_t
MWHHDPVSAVMTLELPPDVLQSARITVDEVRLEIAVALFQSERLSLGRAAELAEMSVAAFQGFLASRHIGPHYSESDAREDAIMLAGVATALGNELRLKAGFWISNDLMA